MKRKQPSKKLSLNEITKTARLIERLSPIPFMEELVFKTFWKKRLMPFVALELLIFEKSLFAPSTKNLPRVLLTYRTDEYYNCWHVPGGFLGGDEEYKQAVKRILSRELGVYPKTIQPLFAVSRAHGNRDHHISMFIAVTPTTFPQLRKGSIEYFNPSKPPRKLIPYYLETFRVLKNIHSLSKTLSPDQRRRFLKCLEIREVLS
jgi:ADP-ribose pyrophosphatase YjhB (NUDIX family)